MVVAENVTHAAVMNTIQASAPAGMLRSAVLFDVFRPKAGSAGGLAEGEKSLAIRLLLGAEGTAALTDADIESAIQGILGSLAEKTGARLR